MATPRARLIDPEQPLFYHVVSRCVRRSWLCGRDKRSRRDYSHRKQWLIDRLDQLAAVFPVEVHAYAIMSNHFHLVLYYDPTAQHNWSDEEVARRWYSACPPRDASGAVDEALKTLLVEQLVEQPDRIALIRKRLGSWSTFMQLLKQPIARRANLEDGFTGHFFEQRFYSGALLSEAAVIAAMAYVDLNPIRARVAKSLRACRHTGIERRLQAANLDQALKEAVAPLVSGLEEGAQLSLTLASYVDLLESRTSQDQDKRDKSHLWHQWVSALKRQQRVYGPAELVATWLSRRNMQLRELALP